MCIKSRRRKEDYAAVIQSIKNLLEQSKLQRFVLDFEDATWKSVESVFPDVERKGCAFHCAQALWRHIQEEELQLTYTNDGETYRFLRKVMALCYVPAKHISACARKNTQTWSFALKKHQLLEGVVS
ncbi:hypothetical protein LSH36_40g13034 [Paralvinella palmiformis]|uniref:MULE transposase domain-containing protein n=1 Tax=Paralvinella palmiformis TaxID=53620 RepID=A0AAD9K7J6_9ANNE|nr:hypothetical protein LSH36_40g13034 [Paralvinella palmiformis]